MVFRGRGAGGGERGSRFRPTFSPNAVTASAKSRLHDAGEDAGVWFHPLQGPLPAREPIDRSPRIAVFNASGTTDQSVWSLRNLGFTADPFSPANLNMAPTDPLLGYDVLFTLSNFPSTAPANATARARGSPRSSTAAAATSAPGRAVRAS